MCVSLYQVLTHINKTPVVVKFEMTDTELAPGVPHRIDAFEAALGYICNHARVWKATGAEIARHYRAQIAKQ